MTDRNPNVREEERSARELVQDIGHDIGEIVRTELRLAQAELKQSAQQAGKAVGLLGGAAMCAVLTVMCGVVFGIWALSLAMPWGVASLLMAVFLACIAGALYAGGRGRLRKVDAVPHRTLETLKEPLR
jgi:uncharacterized membrane protein YqjE